MKGSEIYMDKQNIQVPELPKGIQATLIDYFKDTESFDLKQANELLLEHQNRDVNAESIRARSILLPDLWQALLRDSPGYKSIKLSFTV